MQSNTYLSLALISSQFEITDMQLVAFNQEYEAVDFESYGVTYKSRRAKKTPRKVGYFVAVWQKDAQQQNEPFTAENAADYLIVAIIDGKQRGYFTFPKAILIKQHILTAHNIIGKMAFRVYPTWVTDLNKTATNTQKWQTPYFTDLSSK